MQLIFPFLRDIVTSVFAKVSYLLQSFGFAVYLIANSYAEWNESPVSTVVSTRPISDLGFPEVTVCPPKGSNTALNQVLERVKDEEFTPGLQSDLKKTIGKWFFTDPARKFAENMAQIINIQDRKIEKTENLIHIQLNTSTMENLSLIHI